MSWMQKLCEAYDAGIACDQSNEATPLAPLGFARKKVKYHVVLTSDGRFVSADELAGEAQWQIVPITFEAESRTGSSAMPFPLVDQMKYLVNSQENAKRFAKYLSQLKGWCAQPDAPDCLRTVCAYLERGTLLSDLESQPNLKLKYYKNPQAREGEGEDGRSLVCFSVQTGDVGPDDLWRRDDVRKSWSRYLAMQPGDLEFCYVEGKMLPVPQNHPKLEWPGNAKLISAQDGIYRFLYKGRFVEQGSAAPVSFDASARAHNALNWLTARQGMRRYGATWVVWNTNGAMMKVPLEPQNGFFEEEEEEEEDSRPVVDMFNSYADEVGKAARGYGGRLHDYNPDRVNCAVILGMQAATDGRMSLNYYQECEGNEYVRRLESWYRDCCWWRYLTAEKAGRIATPNPERIAAAVLGNDAVYKANGDRNGDNPPTRLMRQLEGRLLSCIANQRPIPEDIVRAAFNRACSPLTFVVEKEQKWSRFSWESGVSVACALIFGFQNRTEKAEKFPPNLQTNSQNRAYLYGRLLAVADALEKKATGGENPTNAIRLLRRFVSRPFETWARIHEKLLPSLYKLGPDSAFYQRAFGEIEGLFSEEDRQNRGELSWEFLQGFSSQWLWLGQTQKPADMQVPDVQTPDTQVPDVQTPDTQAPDTQASDTQAPDTQAPDRQYTLPKRRAGLYGCLLAIADMAEQEAGDGERAGRTNALRLMPLFAARPYEAWGKLHDKLLPYLEKLGSKSNFYHWLLGAVEAQFSRPDRTSVVPLDGDYLHGYYGMRRALFAKARFFREPQTWEDEPDRSALYGQMLGIADRIERAWLEKQSRIGGADWRATNEMRRMAAFAQKPAAIWYGLKGKLQPYLRHAGPRAARDRARLEQLEEELLRRGWAGNEPLESVYLHEYYTNK